MSSNLQDGSALDHEHGLLEDRLRGLILKNSQPKTLNTEVPLRLASTVVPSFTDETTGLQRGEILKQQFSETTSGAAHHHQSEHSNRKRLNQAQRRQMSAQTSITIDPRQVPQEYQNGRGFSQSTGFGWQSRPHGSAIRQPNQTQHSLNQSPVLSQDAKQTSLHSLQQQNQNQYGNPMMHQTHTVPQQGGISQLNSARYGAHLPNSFNDYRTQEPVYGMAPAQRGMRRPHQQSRLYQPGPYSGRGYGASQSVFSEQLMAQSGFLNTLLDQYVPKIIINDQEVQEKEQFRSFVEQICREAILSHENFDKNNTDFNPEEVELRCFGSMASGFATKASDMDLALLTPHSQPPPDSPESPIPRLLEKKLLEMGFGARLLTRTRVPIIKLCQNPTEKLIADLQDERRKWENGFVSCETNEVGQVPEEADKAYGISEKGQKEITEEETLKLPTMTYQDQLASLYQKPRESLMDYYGAANRLLRSFGTHDIDRSDDIPPEQARMVMEVCKAFVNGLTDKELKAHLLTFQSFRFSEMAESDKPRSLRGVFAQIEGGQLALAWDRRPLPEPTEKMEADCQRQIDEWHTMLDKTDIPPMKYNVMLQQAVSRLKRIPSLQLLFLEQGPHETPQQYHIRAAAIFKNLKNQSNDHASAMFITHYLNGIKSPQIQEALQTMTSSNELVPISALALQHRMFQLAHDYENALSKDLYGEQDHADIKQYINYLRSCNADYATQLIDGIAMRTSIENSRESLITKMRSLPDPNHALHKPRDRYKDHLEFPKSDIGIQCDINFSAQLGLHNTLLLRCYSLTDNRVRPLILFIKYWARVRAINTPYRGSLSSYGYVLMVLHYLVNIANPFVCPNLQIFGKSSSYFPPDEYTSTDTCNGYDVRFWRNEKEIEDLARSGSLNHNRDSIGKLLRGFFEYYAQSGPLTIGGRGFDWGRDVLSLRTQGGLLTKQHKGWVGARTVMETRTEAAPASIPTAESTSTQASGNSQQPNNLGNPPKLVGKEEVKEIRHRYLFAIEDPFELDHNVARTVTHDGIVAIRDEFRRAWRIISSVGRKEVQESLLDEVTAEGHAKSELDELMDLLHGKVQEVDKPT